MDIIEFFKDIPASLSVLFSSLITVCIAYSGIMKQRQIAREKNSLDFEAAYKHSIQINEAWDVLISISQNSYKESVKKWAKSENLSSNEALSIRVLLNEWERVANGVFHNIYDSAFLYKIYGSYLIKMHSLLLPYIRERQEKNYRLYYQLDKLVMEWRVKRGREDPNKKFVEEIKKIRKLYAKLE